MNLKPLNQGPIVGEATPDRVRIWGRAKPQVIDNQPRRCFGVIRYRQTGSNRWQQSGVFKMNPNFDMTGVGIIEGLRGDTAYEYEMGYFHSEAELAAVQELDLNWDRASSGYFSTASGNRNTPRTLVVGSCRYLLKTFLGDFFDDRGDKTFRSILRQIDDGMEVDQFIMMGDQIYADDLNALNPDKTVKQFYRRYRDAFGQRYLRKLMSRVPTYMMLDDHEIEDNWPAKATSQDLRTLFPVAMHAFQTYQLSHSPCIPVRNGRLHGTLEKIWYQYTDGCTDVFVTDSRTERELFPGNRKLLSDVQMRALKRWLNDASGRVKIIVTSVPFFPDASSGEGADKWSGFEDQRDELLGHIEDNQIRKVVFFSGDVHASMSLQLESPSGLLITSVVSSAFFWPYPHPSAKKFRTTGTINAGNAGSFRLKNASRVISDDNFTRVEVSPGGMNVEVYGRKGARRSSKEFEF